MPPRCKGISKSRTLGTGILIGAKHIAYVWFDALKSGALAGFYHFPESFGMESRLLQGHVLGFPRDCEQGKGMAPLLT